MNLSLFDDQPPARASDPHTSHLAAAAQTPGSAIAAIVGWLAGRGPRTADEIADAVCADGQRAPGTVITAISRAVRLGHVALVDYDGRSRRGRACARYRVEQP
jgi:hypothetical protein